ncbi:hypothetical protein BWI97_26445 [Siphonobacter sp. BAB-5405]|uniref:SusC/RagA family TonB-linked outer membrane protein n=1 Tax=Siphonobacter sp. BAB-5405 TaxID=1864825 RepID=UPI000C808DA1|nr:SusC/RagA family TonB-linked outer membrane protein [Siphonobacter sp. BAB-5405]PMD86018.1 hypothetical protein BWI97_26445 [Siphonobacter sp. BAB-5405]
MKKIYWLLLPLLLLSLPGFCQDRIIKGTVSDKNEALPGVSIYEKGVPTNGTTTDANGNFRLTIKGSASILVIRSIGYKLAEEQVGSRTTINVTLESEEQGLNEVIVVGFGEQKKITLTGAVSMVSGKEIRENPSASLQNTLAGRLPGFFSQQPSGRPGADGADFYIRGVSSYNGNNRPLIIVDDIEYSYEQFARLDPNEIENLSILKDASTTAIYGVRGANGVVVVSTRRGKEGPAKISVRIESSLTQPTKIPQYLDAYESARLYNQAQINDNNANPNPNFRPRFSQEDLELFRNGNDPYGHPNINWKDVLFKKFSEQYRGNLDLSGGTERVQVFCIAGVSLSEWNAKRFRSGPGGQ